MQELSFDIKTEGNALRIALFCYKSFDNFTRECPGIVEGHILMALIVIIDF